MNLLTCLSARNMQARQASAQIALEGRLLVLAARSDGLSDDKIRREFEKAACRELGNDGPVAQGMLTTFLKAVDDTIAGRPETT